MVNFGRKSSQQKDFSKLENEQETTTPNRSSDDDDDEEDTHSDNEEDLQQDANGDEDQPLIQRLESENARLQEHLFPDLQKNQADKREFGQRQRRNQ